MKRKMSQNPPTFEGTTLKWCESVKYLGVNLDEKLSFKKHIDYCVDKTRKAVASIYCLLKKNSHVNVHSKLLLYKSYIRPLMTYACPIFSNCPKTHFNKLQIWQNKCLRMALSAPYDTRVTELHNKANVPYIRNFVDDLTNRFYEKVKNHSNSLVNQLGDYSSDSVPFRIKHRLPRALWSVRLTNLLVLVFFFFLFFFFFF
jgi:hypothetical protein